MRRRTFWQLKWAFACAATALAFASIPAGLIFAADAPTVDFRRDVLPLLSDRCFACHGPDEAARQADLRLDQRDAATAAKAIVPGDPDASELVRRILSTDADEAMPPPEAKKKLDDRERQILVAWVREGAEYRPHWSFIPPQRPTLPAVKDDDWVRNPIDAFVLARLDAEGLSPAPEADRRTLIRRLSLDLTGLPPSADEVEAFVADQSDGAYERLVDRLLASPHFGERMALDWLDAARYADTNGYSIDGGRHIWLWRDWVIDAFNRNLPYNQFLVEQLAGDLMPNPTEAQFIATGFERNNMVTHEGGTIPEENLTNYNVDRVKTLGEAVLGLTLGCAQCHNHKFDPITQRDYYQLYAYFNTLSEQGLDGDRGINARPSLNAKTVLHAGDAPALQQQIAQLKDELANPDPAKVAEWEAEQRAVLELRGKNLELHPVELMKVSTPNIGAGYEIGEGKYVRITVPQELVAYDVSLRLPALDRPITGLRIVFRTDPKARGRGWGHGSLTDPWPPPTDDKKAAPDKKPAEVAKGTFVLTSLTLSAEEVPSDQVNLHHQVGIERVTASSSLAGFPPEAVLDPRNEDGWTPNTAEGGPIHLTATFDKPLDPATAPYLTAQLNFGYGKNLVAGRFEIWAMTGTDDGSPLPRNVIAILQMADDLRTNDERAQLRAYFADHAAATAPLRTSLANLEERVAALTERFPTLVMDQADKPRETFILNRGDYAQPKDKVTAATPAVLPPPPEGAPANRLGLAEWVTMPGHPLTARVAVNRIWRLCFGAGIVRTPADFGAQGEFPSHPELLDWLAVDFRENGWDVKRLVRQIAMSATYRQSSVPSEKLLERDPDNRLLARGPRFRLGAESIRDSALTVSGLLVPWIGGPSVNPYSPGDLWREISHYGSTPATAQTFVQDHGEKLYRRSLYTYWKRTVPPPNMAAFDAPNRETCVVARPVTTTPLQALVLLNDVQFVEAARSFAERIVNHSADDFDRLRWAFEECVSRLPTDQELAVLNKSLERERHRYAGDEAAAREYLASGESPRDERIPVAEHAAWSQVATLLLNLSETVTRN